jgi:hypothetical protein
MARSIKPFQNPAVVVERATKIDGVLLDQEANVEAVVLARPTSVDGELQTIGTPTSPVASHDYTPGLTCVTQGAIVVPAGQTITVAPADAHDYVEIGYPGGQGSGGRIYLAAGGQADAEFCFNWLDEGEELERWTSDVITAFNSGTVDVQLIRGTWATP